MSVLQFFIDNALKDEFYQARVLEVGSKYVWGSVRQLVERFLVPREI